MWKAVVVDRDYGSVSLENQKKLQEQYTVNGIDLRLEHYKTPEEIVAGCQDADAILGTGNPLITRKVLEALPKLKIVQRFGIGVNSVDLEAATKEGTIILYMPGFCAQELAIHASSLILNLLRNVTYYDRGIRAGEWRKAQGPLPRTPKNLTLGLYGFGDSAKPLCTIFHKGIGTKVIVCDPYVKENVAEDFGVELVSFPELLERSDILSIHAPLTLETRHIFNRDAFRKMKSNAMIINVARGELIHQGDLVEALETGEIGFAGLDVFETEPLPADSPLIGNDKTVLTCHSAFYGDEAQRTQLRLAVDLVDAVLNKKRVSGKYIANRAVRSKIENLEITA